MEYVIESQNLSKTFRSYEKNPGLRGAIRSLWHRPYKESHAVDDFNLQVKSGEMIALLGPNGAGKTTIMKMWTGIIVPSSGQVQVIGHDPWKRDKQFRKKIALVMGQKSQLWWDIPALDSFLLLQKYYEIPDNEFKQRLDMLSTILQVQDKLKIHVRKLSLGERMKLELLASFLHSPDIIFLDEPTIGLDLVAQENIRNFLLDYHRQHQCTIVVTSHYMADVEALCKRLILIIGGTKHFDGPIEQFTQILGKNKIVTFNFSQAIDHTLDLWSDFEPTWNEMRTQVALRVPMEKLKDVTVQILNQFPVSEFSTEKLPIERVMKKILENPSLTKWGQPSS
ncbi:MAG: multidrug ABC transporter ATP-binding protein [Bdellovibrionales bacterium GWA2_49_15]|nr:MAG: multidrug ABC transporter ATP-binding protein [Bdellovibrionales bacterium GWA2_49_15]HAZ12301.1 multidrug ABC transporter ATP-binding protein [Bdellovibrionales bacterium]